MARTNRRTSLCSDEQAHFYVSIFTYDPASIARTVFRTPSNRIVKRISTPTRRKISLVDDKKKKRKKETEEEKFRIPPKSPPKWFTRAILAHCREIIRSESYARKQQRRRSLSSIRFLRSIEGEKTRERVDTREGECTKNPRRFVHAAHLISNPFLSRAKNFTKTSVHISYRDLWNLSWDLSPPEKGW